MQQYKIRPDGFKEFKKKMLTLWLPLMIIIGIVGISMVVLNSKDKAINEKVLPIFIPFIALTFGFSLYRSLKRQRALFESYKLTLTNNLISREQLNTPTISLYFNEVQEIVKYKNKSFIVRGKDPTDLIVIPAQVENYNELENALSQIKPITTKLSKSFFERYGIALILFNIACMLCVYTVSNKIVVAISGILFVFIYTKNLNVIRKNKNIDIKTKGSMGWAVLVLVSVIAVTIFKLVGFPKT